MKVQEWFCGTGQKIRWWQAAEIIGIRDRQMRRWRERYEEFGFRGLFDRRARKSAPADPAIVTAGDVNHAAR